MAGDSQSLTPRAGSPWRSDPRVLLADRLAAGAIRLGGLGVIAAVLGMAAFILATVWPLFAPSRAGQALALPAPPSRAALALADEHLARVLSLGLDGRAWSLDREAGAWEALAAPVLAEPALAAALAPDQPWMGLGLAGGRARVYRPEFKVAFDAAGKRRSLAELGPPLELQVDPRGRGLDLLALGGRGSRVALLGRCAPRAFAALRAEGEGAAWRGRGWAAELPAEEAPISALLAHSGGERFLLGTRSGRVLEYALGPRGLSLSAAFQALPQGEAVGALAFTIGEQSLLVGGEAGSLQGWSLLQREGAGQAWTRLHAFAPQPGGIAAFSVSQRDRSFLALGPGGLARAHYLSSERTLFELQPGPRPARVLRLAPKGDALLALKQDGSLELRALSNPHPEVSWKALFGKVWYEGYEKPDYVWQSTGGSDDFEPKFSLVPLIYGTVKGTFYALLFAVPLAILAALYTSQFMHRRLRALVKPTVELMAALPSVVLGFLAALVLAPAIEQHLLGVALGALLLPLAGLGTLFAWRALPPAWTRRVGPESELAVMLAGLGLGLLAAALLAQPLETLLFGDLKTWLYNRWGLAYDQRNSVVVGFAMGFAVIPVIYTICEDALSSVPSHLTAASLSAGATPWQTATRVVLPVALSGIFSAVMVGFGRAVGETMIVLMATGNTAVMEFTPFNGFRALSANIAVEIPEAPVGGTLYRVLFLAGLLLFAVTFLVNTAAELVRLRLRRKYSQL